MDNNFPPRPNIATNPVPTWATSTNSVKSDPGDSKRSQGWIFNSSLNSGEIPRLDWVNNEAYNTGVWCKYFDDCSTFLKNLIYPSDTSYPAANVSYFVVKNYNTAKKPLASGDVITLDSVNVNTDNIIAYDFATGTFTAPLTDHYRISINLIIEVSSTKVADRRKLFSVTENYPVNTAGNVSGNRIYTTYRDNFLSAIPYGTGNGSNLVVNSVITRKLNLGDKIQFLAATTSYSPNFPLDYVNWISGGSSISYSWKF